MGIGSFFKKTTSRFDDNVLNRIDNRLNSPGGFGAEVDAAYSFPANYSPLLKRNKKLGKATKVAGIGLTGNASAGIFSYAKDKGYSDDEAGHDAITVGSTHQSVAAENTARVAGEADQAALADFTKRQQAELRKERLSKDVRARRARNANLPGNKNGTLLTGSLGLAGDASTKLGS